MPTEEDVITWICLLLVIGVIGFAFVHYFNPKNRLSRGLEAFWNTPTIKDFRLLIWKAFWVLLLGWIALSGIQYYFNESGWYAREREIEVFFKAHQWTEGEIQTCYSDQSKTSPDGELTFISCRLELNESHVFRVKFWGPIKADKNKVWKCERHQTSMTCRLQ
jgi:hypothetical protein